LVYVPWATLFWLLLLVYVGLGQHTMLGIVGLCGASGNTLYWVLLLYGLCGILLLVTLRFGQHIYWLAIVVGL
jgi:hypothetical protein